MLSERKQLIQYFEETVDGVVEVEEHDQEPTPVANDWQALFEKDDRTPPPLLSKDFWQAIKVASGWRAFEHRNRYIRKGGWCILTQEVAQELANFIRGQHVIELLAGTGYIAHHLRALSGLTRQQYKAYDNRESHQFSDTVNYPGVTKKNARMAPIKSADIVIMTWPMYDNPLASHLIKKMVKGQYLIFNGEGYGGCTADDAFYERLQEDFVTLEEMTERLDDHHVRWFGINDHWTILQKVN